MLSVDISKLGPIVLWSLLRKPRWLQVVTQRKATWPSQNQVEDWRNNIPTPRDDGAHPSESPFYFEWWYFDAVFAQGTKLSVILHLTDLIKPASTLGSINVSVFGHDKPVLNRFIQYNRDSIQASSDACDVRIGSNRCLAGEDGDYSVHIDETDFQADLLFKTSAVGWRPGNGKFYFGERDFFSWIVPQPRARVQGKFVIQGEERQVSGWGYHDHNWGTVSLLDAVSEWSWGRLYLGDYTCVFADIRLSARYKDTRVMPYALFHKDQVLVSSFLQCNDPLDPDRDFLRRPWAAQSPEGWRLYWEKLGKQLALELKTRDMLEKADLLGGSSIRQWVMEKLIAHPYYVRCYVTAQGEWKRGTELHDLRGHGIYEQISFHRCATRSEPEVISAP
jgi:hypothetical protein